MSQYRVQHSELLQTRIEQLELPLKRERDGGAAEVKGLTAQKSTVLGFLLRPTKMRRIASFQKFELSLTNFGLQ